MLSVEIKISTPDNNVAVIAETMTKALLNLPDGTVVHSFLVEEEDA